MNWIPYGPDAALFQFPGGKGKETGPLQKIAAALERDFPDELMEYVPGISTLLIIFKSSRDLSLAQRAEDISAWMKKAAVESRLPPTLHEIPVCYHGVDLKTLAQTHGLSSEEVVAIHSASTYSVQMLGFSPGFPYLGPLDSRLHTPRLSTPRSRIAPGSVAIGGPHTGIYTMETAGGWHILGHTSVKIFDPGRHATDHEKDMFLLKPGDQVRFIPSHE